MGLINSGLVDRIKSWSWKSSLSGFAVIAVTVAFSLGKLSSDQFLYALGALVGVGLISAKDADVK